MNSFKCTKCSYNTIRNYDLTRHLKNVHGIYANTSFKGDDHLQIGIPSRMSEERQYEVESQHSKMSEEENEPRKDPVDGLYFPERHDSSEENDMMRKKCRILDCVLDTFPEHLKTKAKSMCDFLKCKERLFILPSHEIVIDGVVDRGSNIRDYIMDSLIEPPIPGTSKFTLLEKENERLKRNLAYYEKAMARARGVSRCRKFESIIDGTVDRCDFSDDTNSDESDEEGEDEEDEEDDTDVTGEDDDDEEEDDMDDDEEYEEDDEPIKKKRN